MFMPVPVPYPFTGFVTAIMSQTEDNVAPCFKENHGLILRSACRETEHDKLVNGIHQMRWVIAEGGSLHQWITLLNRTIGKASFPLTILKRELTFGWLLLQNDQIESAVYAYQQASDQLERMLISKNSVKQWPYLYQAWLDIAVGRLMIRANRHATTADVDEALYVWEHASRQSAAHCDRRLLLALAAVQLAAGMTEACHAVVNSIYDYFETRNMNVEAGLAAFFLMRCAALDQGIDPLCMPVSGTSYTWLMKAVRHWRDCLELPIGLRLLRPYASALDLDMSFSRPSLLNPQLNPKANICN
jgi:hypothetical protein